MPARRGGSADSHTAPRGRTDFFRLDYSGYQGYVLLDLTELSSYLPLVPCFEFGNASGTLFPCTEGRVWTRMVPAGTPRAGAFSSGHAILCSQGKWGRGALPLVRY